MKTAVEAVFIGKDRKFNRRFEQLMSHHLIEPTACTPAAGWEKGQVENQVGVVRKRFFAPRPSFKTLEDLNGWLADKCVAYAKTQPHPEQTDKTVFEMFEAERPVLMAYRGAFDGFHATAASVSKTCLVRFDRNKYSVKSSAVGRPVDIHAYADRIVLKQDGVVVASMPAGSAATRPPMIPGTTCRCWRRSQERSGTARRSRTGRCRVDREDPAQAGRQRRRRPADGQDPDRRADRWLGRGRGRVRGIARRQHRQCRRDPECAGATTTA